jgi:hypothetical protein
MSPNCEKDKLIEAAKYMKACGLGGSKSSLYYGIRAIELREKLKGDGLAKDGRRKVNDKTVALVYGRNTSLEDSEQLYNVALKHLKDDPNIKSSVLNGVIRGVKRELGHKQEDHSTLKERFVVALKKEGWVLKLKEATLAGPVDIVTNDKTTLFEVEAHISNPRTDTARMATALGKLLIHKTFYPNAKLYIATSDKISVAWRNAFKKFGIGNVIILTGGGLLYYDAESRSNEVVQSQALKA